MSKWTELVAKPSADSINSGLSALKTARLYGILGAPRTHLTADCQPVTNAKLSARIVTASVGPFKVTGLDIAVESLKAVTADIQREKHELYFLLGSAGMLCCRLVRGSEDTPSNHSFGTAVDLTVGGMLDARGDDKVQRGLLEVYPIFHRHGWYWGAEYPTEDAMHFELAWETFQELNRGR